MDEGKFVEAIRADRIAIGRSIVKARERQGMTSSELADRIGMDRSNFHKVEVGEHNLTMQTLTRVGAALSMRLEVNFTGLPDSAHRRVGEDAQALEADAAGGGEPPVTPP